ncbi:hypothetical protein [Streptomyces sp. NPDC007984]|jgi:hypothetical protein|uniref:hypothetical protein n=1 Tax=Streptomyces sp. NPDC007984 TaxID=3364801 RepID=UPI0036EF970E
MADINSGERWRIEAVTAGSHSGHRALMWDAGSCRYRMGATLKETITQVVTAFSPIAIALITGFFGARLGRRTRSDKIMERLKAEIEASEALPAGSVAKETLQKQLDATANKYTETCKHEDAFRRDSFGVVLGLILGGAGVVLGSWAALAGGSYLWWWVLAIPLIVFGVPGFFYEMAGGKSREVPATPPTRADDANA